MQRSRVGHAGVRPRRVRLSVGRPGRRGGVAPAAKGEHRAEEAAALGVHRVPLRLGIPLRGAGVRPAGEELAGDRGRMQIEDALHVFQTAWRAAFFPAGMKRVLSAH
jgi:hypothetical protein